jgi:restriction endonuclease S subunit
VAEQVITYSIIQKSQLESMNRLDAEYYQPEYLRVSEKIKLLPHKTLEDISESIMSFGAYALTNFIEWQEEGIPFIVAENIKEGFISYEGVRYITNKTDEILKKSRVQEGQVLLSMSGSVGNAAIAYKIPPKLNSNQDIVKIRPKENFSAYCLATFLNSKYGRMQVLRLPVGSIQQHIFLWQTKSLLVPVFPTHFIDNIEKIYKEGLNQLEISKSLYSKAGDLLLEELGLKDFKPNEELSFIINLSEVKSARRTDAEYFQPKYKRIIEKLKKENVKLLGDLVSMKKGFEPGSEEYQDEGKLFIRVSNISKNGLIDKDQKYLSNELYQKLKKDFVPRPGEILLTKDATPGIAYVLKESIEGVIAGGIVRLMLKEDIAAEYLALFINSIIGQMQNERDAGGSVIAHWKPDQIKKLQVPVLPKSTQHKIADLVYQSHEARKKAKELLEKAKREVEELVEKNQEQ